MGLLTFFGDVVQGVVDACLLVMTETEKVLKLILTPAVVDNLAVG